MRLDGPLARAGAAQPGAPHAARRRARRRRNRRCSPCHWLSATGTGILIAALVAGLVHGLLRAGPREDLRPHVRLVSLSLLTIAAMLALGFTTRYSGLDATLGLAFAGTGVLYPFFGTMLGWLGVALTGSDTSSNVLFGSLQRITAEQLGLSPVLMAAANSSGGVMGKMIDAQSIVVPAPRHGGTGTKAISCATCSGTASLWPRWSASSCCCRRTCRHSRSWSAGDGRTDSPKRSPRRARAPKRAR